MRDKFIGKTKTGGSLQITILQAMQQLFSEHFLSANAQEVLSYVPVI